MSVLSDWNLSPAGVAQLAAHFTCNEGVPGSSPGAGSDTAITQAFDPAVTSPVRS